MNLPASKLQQTVNRALITNDEGRTTANGQGENGTGRRLKPVTPLGTTPQRQEVRTTPPRRYQVGDRLTRSAPGRPAELASRASCRSSRYALPDYGEKRIGCSWPDWKVTSSTRGAAT